MKGCKFRRIFILPVLISFLYANNSAAAPPFLPGDINNDGGIDLIDAILALESMSSITTPVSVFKEADINNDGRIGLEEAIYDIQVVAGFKIDADNDGYTANVDCNDNDAGINPGALEDCADTTDNDCNTFTDCADPACTGYPACLAALCNLYPDRQSCSADPNCVWSGRNKVCEISGGGPMVTCSDYDNTSRAICEAAGCRWNNQRLTCR